MTSTHNFKTATFVLGILAASACAGVKKTTTPINPSMQRSPTCADAIVVYSSRSEVPHDYYELAFIEAEGNSVYTTDNKLQVQIRNAAAKVGASAVITNPVEQSKTTVKVLGEALGTRSATARASALAIYIPSDRARVTAACGTK